MPNIRVPNAAEPLLPFCKPWSGRVANPSFATYADLIMFAAGVGFSHLAGRSAPPCPAFIEDRQPYAIDFTVFKNPASQLYPLILLLSLASEKTHQAVRDEERLARTVENYASVGLQQLAQKLATTTPEEFHIELAQLLVDAAT